MRTPGRHSRVVWGELDVCDTPGPRVSLTVRARIEGAPMSRDDLSSSPSRRDDAWGDDAWSDSAIPGDGSAGDEFLARSERRRARHRDENRRLPWALIVAGGLALVLGLGAAAWALLRDDEQSVSACPAGTLRVSVSPEIAEAVDSALTRRRRGRVRQVQRLARERGRGRPGDQRGRRPRGVDPGLVDVGGCHRHRRLAGAVDRRAVRRQLSRRPGSPGQGHPGQLVEPAPQQQRRPADGQP